MFNAFLEPCCPCGIGTNGNRVIAAVALPGTIPLASPKVTDYSIRRQPVAQLSCSVTCPVNVVSRGHGSQLVSEFFGGGCQTSDAVLAITVFEGGGTFVHVRLAPSQEPVNKSS